MNIREENAKSYLFFHTEVYLSYMGYISYHFCNARVECEQYNCKFMFYKGELCDCIKCENFIVKQNMCFSLMGLEYRLGVDNEEQWSDNLQC